MDSKVATYTKKKIFWFLVFGFSLSNEYVELLSLNHLLLSLISTLLKLEISNFLNFEISSFSRVEISKQTNAKADDSNS